MRRVALATACAAALFVVAPAAAQAFNTFWEVKEGANFKTLPLGTPETLNSAGKIGVVGRNKNKPFKTGCALADVETIENEVSSGEGIDHMTSFGFECGPAAPFPCLVTEGVRVRGLKLPWFSELVLPKNDDFSGVELEVECTGSGIKGIYKPFGLVWTPQLITNGLKTSAAAGVFKNSPGNWFYLTGIDGLTPTNPLYTEVR